MRRACCRDNLQPVIAPDAVIHMHHQIAGAEALRLCQEILGPALFLGCADEPVAQHVLFGDHCHIGRFKPALQRPDRQMQPPLADAARVTDVDRFGQPLIFDQPGQPFARAFGI